MRAYTIAAVAVTLGTTTKWLDNVLSHHRVHGVSRARQGVARRLSPQAVIILEVAVRLSQTLAAPVSYCLNIAADVVTRRAETVQVKLGEGITLHVNLALIEGETFERLADAVETAPTPKRGRPRRK